MHKQKSIVRLSTSRKVHDKGLVIVSHSNYKTSLRSQAVYPCARVIQWKRKNAFDRAICTAHRIHSWPFSSHMVQRYVPVRFFRQMKIFVVLIRKNH